MESSKETGCQTPEGPILCINNCGFFGSATTMNMCSKCHKEMILQQEKLAANSMFAPLSKGKEPAAITFPGFQFGSEVTPPPGHSDFSFGANSEVKAKNKFSFEASSEVKANTGPNRCTTCHKRVGLTGFSCRCGNVFCAVHRYSDKHECQFDYRAAAQDAITKANPVVKAEKLDKI